MYDFEFSENLARAGAAAWRAWPGLNVGWTHAYFGFQLQPDYRAKICWSSAACDRLAHAGLDSDCSIANRPGLSGLGRLAAIWAWWSWATGLAEWAERRKLERAKQPLRLHAAKS